MDITQFLQSTSRELASGIKDGEPVKILKASRTYATDQESLWNLVTNPEKLQQWFLPLEGDLKVGGRFQFQGNAGGEILACKKPDFVHVTWEMQGQPSWVELHFTAAEGGTTLVLQHTASVPKEFWDTYGPGAVGIGWELGLLGLDMIVITGETMKDEDKHTWPGTPEGKEFVKASSEGWAQASIADGTPPAAANEARDQVFKFYTGQQ